MAISARAVARRLEENIRYPLRKVRAGQTVGSRFLRSALPIVSCHRHVRDRQSPIPGSPVYGEAGLEKAGAPTALSPFCFLLDLL